MCSMRFMCDGDDMGQAFAQLDGSKPFHPAISIYGSSARIKVAFEMSSSRFFPRIKRLYPEVRALEMPISFWSLLGMDWSSMDSLSHMGHVHEQWFDPLERAILAQPAILGIIKNNAHLSSIASEWLRLSSEKLQQKDKEEALLKVGLDLYASGFSASAIVAALIKYSENMDAMIVFLLDHPNADNSALEQDAGTQAHYTSLLASFTSNDATSASSQLTLRASKTTFSLSKVLAKPADLTSLITDSLSSASTSFPPFFRQIQFPSIEQTEVDEFYEAHSHVEQALSVVQARHVLLVILQQLTGVLESEKEDSQESKGEEESVEKEEKDEKEEVEEEEEEETNREQVEIVSAVQKAEKLVALPWWKPLIHWLTSPASAPSASAPTSATSPVLSLLLRLTLASRDAATCRNLRSVLLPLLLAETTTDDHPVTSCLVGELLLQLVVSLRSTHSSQSELCAVPESEKAAMECSSSHLQLMYWLIELFLDVVMTLRANRPTLEARFAGRAFPECLIKLLRRLLQYADPAPQFRILSLIQSILSLPSLSFTITDTAVSLFSAMANLYNTESPTSEASCSKTLSALIQLNWLLYDRLKLSQVPEVVVPEFFQKLLQFREVLAFLRGSHARLSEPVLALLCPSGVSTDQFYETHRRFTPTMDQELIDAVTRYENSNNMVMVPPASQLSLYKHLTAVSYEVLTARYEVLTKYSELYKGVFRCVAASLQAPTGGELVNLVRAGRDYMVWSVKKEMWRQAMSSTQSYGGYGTIQVNMLLASELVNQKQMDSKLKNSCFGQVMRKLKDLEPTFMRQGLDERAFQVSMLGLNAVDAGGPYRQVLETMVQELHSPYLPLFVPCPNATSETGDNRDKFVPRRLPPNDRLTDRQLRLQAYEFVGQLMGLAIRTQNLLPFQLPSIVWKALVGETITLEDVRAIDTLSYDFIDDVRQKGEEYPPDQFDYLMGEVKFEVPTAEGKLVPLLPGGSKIRLSSKNRAMFLETITKFRIHEYSEQCDAIRRGLATVVPYQLLCLFSWRQIEQQIVGSGIDIDLWKRNTTYEGCYENDSHIRLFWQMIRERFDDASRQKFINFVWGRSRLPTSQATWTRAFKIQDMGLRDGYRTIDHMFPIAHTCFFSVELPRYSNLDIMTERVTFAMTNCTEIDGDGMQGHGDINMQLDRDDEGDDDTSEEEYEEEE
eukprot:TRINITY_DN2092_c0_g3_i1.p1 TRINITY_DN2092_c0_g3~~TRINITY_DN2092_c0_g3_i1.p1  ORF type:complete len:1184 (-),score=414.41 TRINITY_DN2092_c0_g3_i1:81-3632(-)